MRGRTSIAFLACAMFVQRAHAFEPPGVFPPRIVENFDEFPSGLELSTVYPQLNPANPNGAIVTDSPLDFPGIDGAAAGFTTMGGALHRIQNEELMILDPMVFGPLVFQADIYDDGVAEFKRAHVDARYQPFGGPQQFIQMGMRPFPDGPFGYQQVGFLGISAQWKSFPLPEDMNERAEIGPGWHRYTVFMTMSELIFQLDLHRDGTIDAIDFEPTLMLPGGFTEVRFGKLGFQPEPSLIAFDNIYLGVLPEPSSLTLVAGVVAVLAGTRRSRYSTLATS